MTGPSRAELIARAVVRLAGAGVPEPERDARLLYRWAAGMDGATFSASLSETATAREIDRFDNAIAAREGRAPVSHITGRREFWGRDFRVTPAVLDPRPETETLIARALDGRPARRILDLGTGSGCILLTLLAESPQAQGVGVDISAAALEVARHNAVELGVETRSTFIHGNWTAGLEGAFDLIVSNPPYIAASEMAGLSPEVRLHEPLSALVPSDNPTCDGLDAYRAIAGAIGPFLAPEGRILLEIGPQPTSAVTGILRAAGLSEIQVFPDMDERDRVISARK